MSFDLSSARPVQPAPVQSGGFDLASAQPVARQPLEASPTASPAQPERPLADQAGHLINVGTGAVNRGILQTGDALVSAPYKVAQLGTAALGYLAQQYGPDWLAKFAQEHTGFAEQPAPTPLQDFGRVSGTESPNVLPQTQGEKYLSTAGEMLGATAAGGGISPAAPLRSAVQAIGAGTGQQVAREISPNNPLAEVAGAVIGGSAGNLVAATPQAIQRTAKALSGPLPNTPQAALVQEGARQGVNIPTSDVFPPQTKFGALVRDTGESVPVIGSSGRVTQKTQRVNAVQNLLDEYGAGYGQDFRPIVAQELIKKHESMIARYAGDKEAIKGASTGVVQTPYVEAKINSIIADNQRKFAAGNKNVADEANAELKTFGELLKGKNLADLEDARKYLGTQLADPNKAGIKDILEKSKDQVYNALKADIERHIGAEQGSAALAKWRNANDKLSSIINETTKTSLGNVLNKSELTPEAVGQLMHSVNPSDVARINANLTSAGRAAARSGVIQKAYDSSVRAGGFSEDAFATNLEKELNKSGAFFNAQDKAQAEGLVRVLKATKRATSASLLPETGAKLSIQAAIASISGALGGIGPGIAGYVSIGALSRAYESAPVRNYLIRLSALPAFAADKEALKLIPFLAGQQAEQNKAGVQQ